MGYDYQPVCAGQVNPLTFAACLEPGIVQHAQLFQINWSPGFPDMDEYTFRETFWIFNPGYPEVMYQAYFNNWGYYRFYDPENEIWWIGNNYLWVSANSPLNPCRLTWKAVTDCPSMGPPGIYPD